MVYYTNFCFCCKTKTGAKCIAILGMVILVLEILIGNFFHVIYLCFLHLQNERNGPLEYIDTYYGRLVSGNVFYLLWVVVCLIATLFCALIFYGIEKNKKNFLLPWLVWQMIGNLVSIINSPIFKCSLIMFRFSFQHFLILSILSRIMGL